MSRKKSCPLKQCFVPYNRCLNVLNEYDFSQFYEIAVKKLVAEGLDKKAAYEIAISVWEKLPNPNIRNCVQIGRLVKNEPDIKIAIADEIQNFKEYGGGQAE
jgi:hypothetical protein